MLVRDGSFVGVLAEREELAIAAAAKLRAKAVWKESPVPEDFHGWLRQNVTSRTVLKEIQGSPPAGKSIRASYSKPFIAHASIGPSCAIARLKDGKLEVWTHSQGIFGLRHELSVVLSMPLERSSCTMREGAGCYGHNGADDVALDAALLARAANGRPVKLQWMREDEFAWEPYGPAMALDLEASLDARGNIVSWQHELWSNGHTNRPGRSPKPALHRGAPSRESRSSFAPAVDPALPPRGRATQRHPALRFPRSAGVKHYVREAPRARVSLRALGAYGNVFAIESFMDELAAEAGGRSDRVPAAPSEGPARPRGDRGSGRAGWPLALERRRTTAAASASRATRTSALLRGGRRGRGGRRAAREAARRSPPTSGSRSIPTAWRTSSRAARSRRRAGR